MRAASRPRTLHPGPRADQADVTCTASARPCRSACAVQEGAPPEVFSPGLFTGGPAPARANLNCSDPFLIPPGSRVPLFLGTATAAYQCEVSALAVARAGTAQKKIGRPGWHQLCTPHRKHRDGCTSPGHPFTRLNAEGGRADGLGGPLARRAGPLRAARGSAGGMYSRQSRSRSPAMPPAPSRQTCTTASSRWVGAAWPASGAFNTTS